MGQLQEKQLRKGQDHLTKALKSLCVMKLSRTFLQNLQTAAQTLIKPSYVVK